MALIRLNVEAETRLQGQTEIRNSFGAAEAHYWCHFELNANDLQSDRRKDHAIASEQGMLRFLAW